MSPLWSDLALARAALADAVARGVVDEPVLEPQERKIRTRLQRVRRIPRPRLTSFAL
jgi:hypothetical protein